MRQQPQQQQQHVQRQQPPAAATEMVATHELRECLLLALDHLLDVPTKGNLESCTLGLESLTLLDWNLMLLDRRSTDRPTQELVNVTVGGWVVCF